MKKLRTLWELFIIFFKIGSFTFGGGLAMLPLIQKEVTDKRNWVSEEEILDIFAISQSVPGVISVNSAIFVGNKTAGVPGAVATVSGVVLPAFVSIILVISILSNMRDSKYVEKVFGGIRAASAALILLSAIKLGKSAMKGKTGYFIAIASFASIVLFNIHAAWSIVLGGFAGYLTYLYGKYRGAKNV